MSIASIARTVPATPADILAINVAGTWQGRFRTHTRARQFDIHVAEPEALGGDDSAPNPLELVLAGLEGCLAVVIEVVAAEFGATVTSVELATEGRLDLRGFLATADVQAYFQSVHTRIEIGIDLSPERFQAFTSAVHRRCPAGSLIDAAPGVDYQLEWVRV